VRVISTIFEKISVITFITNVNVIPPGEMCSGTDHISVSEIITNEIRIDLFITVDVFF
jgi:hypothetical protein